MGYVFCRFSNVLEVCLSSSSRVMTYIMNMLAKSFSVKYILVTKELLNKYGRIYFHPKTFA